MSAAAAPDPLVSVLVPAYNHAPWITACLDSIREEGYRAIEIVLIDDGSSDGTLGRITDWAEAHPAVDIRYSSRLNRGITATLNELLGLARGTYVTPLASDDMLVPGGIAARVRYLEEHEGRRAVFGDCLVIDDEGEVISESGLTGLYRADKSRLATDLATEVICNWSVPGPVLLAERGALQAIGGYDERLAVEDWDLYLKLVARGWLGFIDRGVAAYRRHGSGVSEHLSRSSAHARERADVAWRAARTFRGRWRWLLVGQAAHWRAASARLDGAPTRAIAWKVLARLMRIAANLTPIAGPHPLGDAMP